LSFIAFYEEHFWVDPLIEILWLIL